jgi:pyridoxine 4-dehydrogenase
MDFPEGTVTIGGDLKVRRMGFGAMRLTGRGIWGAPANEDEAIRVLRRAIELGVNLIDTADSYGPEVSERLIAKALHPYPQGLVIATKGGLLRPGPDRWTPNCQPAHLKEACEASLKRLKLERIDLYQLHTADPRVKLEDSIGALAELRAAGKIRHIGVSNFSAPELKRAQAITPIVSVQNMYNMSDRKSDAVVDRCEAEGLGFLPWFPLAVGNLSRGSSRIDATAKRHNATPSQIALAWLLKRSPVMVPIPGTSSVAHLEENVAAAKVQLSDEEFRSLAR